MARSERLGPVDDGSLAARRAAWDRLWRILLAPPVDIDKVSHHAHDDSAVACDTSDDR
jgi:hypothetical protein